MDNNNLNPESIEVPSLDSIQELPKVDLPVLDETVNAQPSSDFQTAQPSAAVTAPASPQMPTVPQAQPVTNTFNYAPAVNPYAAAAQTMIKSKRSAGKIVALVIGIILTVIFGGLFALFLLADALTGFEDLSISIFIHVFFGFFLVIGILLIVLGAKKNKNAVAVNSTVQPYTAMPVQSAAPVPSYSYTPAPVTNNTPAVPNTAAPVQTTAPVPSYSYTSAPITSNTPAVPNTAAPVQTAAPVNPTASVYNAPEPAAVDTNSVAATPSDATGASSSSTQAFDYAPTAMISNDMNDVSKASARKSAFLSMGIVAAMWVIFLALVIFLQRWVLSWYFLIIPVIIAVGAIRSYPKSVLAWISLIVSILSIVMFVFVSILLQPQF